MEEHSRPAAARVYVAPGACSSQRTLSLDIAFTAISGLQPEVVETRAVSCKRLPRQEKAGGSVILCGYGRVGHAVACGVGVPPVRKHTIKYNSRSTAVRQVCSLVGLQPYYVNTDCDRIYCQSDIQNIHKQSRIMVLCLGFVDIIIIIQEF